MAVVWLEPGGDADFGTGLWSGINGSPTIATDFVHGSHVKSIKFPQSVANVQKSNILTDAGSRYSIWIYLNALPTNVSTSICNIQTGGGTDVVKLRLTNGGKLALYETTNQLAIGNTVLQTGVWYRISLAYVITSTTVNDFRLFINGNIEISVHNGTLSNTGTSLWYAGNITPDTQLDLRLSDIYIDNSSALTDPGGIWVTAKRPFSNGTTNGFTTQIGSGGSGYGTGHAPQVNERPNNDANGWSVIGTGSAVTEEYNIESVSAGDINITSANIVDYMGWIRSKALVSETAQIIVNGVSSNISLTSTTAFFTKIAGSTTYPAGTGADIGEITSSTVTTVSLYEAGVIVAYIPFTYPQLVDNTAEVPMDDLRLTEVVNY